ILEAWFLADYSVIHDMPIIFYDKRQAKQAISCRMNATKAPIFGSVPLSVLRLLRYSILFTQRNSR
ncbi:MAG: hypothetical protein K2J31_00465, partial [Alistipes sp.]|nr:hypothetical protein [Alistipes sp.]